ncbi:MAG: UDP-N-acetylmuramyl peptide synthase [Firmicutes bacterium]|nr:UDP-N-acetylmuramyl peptide synthase [Bacillota bacterium]
MRLGDYIDRIKGEGLDVVFSVPGKEGQQPDAADLAKEITGLSCDSRQVSPGTLFVCKGAAFKPEYLQQAIEKGAAAYVAGKDIRRAMAILANMFYDDPWKDMALTGVTGTKGKSTTLYYIKAILEYSKVCGPDRFGFVSTIDTYDGINRFQSHLTTPEIIELTEHLANMRTSGIKMSGIEVSSQALKYDRVYGYRFRYGVFVSFGQDHIGSTEHPDVEDYFRSKLMLFDRSDVAVVNLSNRRIAEVIDAARQCKRIFCCTEENLRKEGGEVCFDAVIYDGIPAPYAKEGDKPAVKRVVKGIRLSMPGLFNAENASEAAAVAMDLGATEEEVVNGLKGVLVEGRMEFYENKERDVIAIADYAHNEISCRKLLESARTEYPGYRLEVVVGFPGGKGIQRRVDIPKVTAELADFTWITEEDPANEDLLEICNEAYGNLVKFGGKGCICPNRQEAAKRAILEAKPKTVVMIIGKGSEAYAYRKGVYYPVPADTELARKYIKM